MMASRCSRFEIESSLHAENEAGQGGLEPMTWSCGWLAWTHVQQAARQQGSSQRLRWAGEANARAGVA